MARGINKVILVGNLGQDPDIRHSDSDKAFGTLNVATTDQWYSREKQENQERTEWHRVRLFGGLADVAERYLHRGDRVYIEGRLETRSYEKDGETRYVAEVVAREMLMLGSRSDSGGDSRPPSSGGGKPRPKADKPAPPPPPADSAPAGDEGFEDDLPF